MTEQTRHLLIVEDEAPLRQAIAEQLEDHGYHVEQAESGEAAISRLADFAFDIIITDLRLPGIDGSSVVEAAVERYPDIVAIVITGYGTFKDAVNAIKRGAHDFVSKPFQIDALLRSEEHTSELQSPCNLVCRLLLEKKKKKTTIVYSIDDTLRYDDYLQVCIVRNHL